MSQPSFFNPSSSSPKIESNLQSNKTSGKNKLILGIGAAVGGVAAYAFSSYRGYLSLNLTSIATAISFPFTTGTGEHESVGGNEFRVNTYTTNYQQHPSVANFGNRGFVVTWDGEGSGDSGGVYGQVYDNSGMALGSNFLVNTYTTNGQGNPSVAGLEEGGFVVTWEGAGPGGASSDIYGQRYNNMGIAQDTNFLVNTYTTGNQRSPTVAGLSNGGFVVTWEGVGLGDSYGIYAQLYDVSGATLGSEFQVNTYTTNTQCCVVVAGLSNGEFVVSWDSRGQSGSGYGIYAQRYYNNGSLSGSEFIVNLNIYTVTDQGAPSIAAYSNGSFVLIWESYGEAAEPNNPGNVYGQRYDDAGSTQGSAFLVNTFTANAEFPHSAAALNDGSFLVTWGGSGDWLGDDNNGYWQADTDLGIYGQLYESTGSGQGSNFLVNTHTVGDQWESSAAAVNDNTFVVTWWGAGIGDDIGIYAKVLSPSVPPSSYAVYVYIGAGGIILATMSAFTINRYLNYRHKHKQRAVTTDAQPRQVNSSPSTKSAKKPGKLNKSSNPLQIHTPLQLNKLIQLSPTLKEYVAGERQLGTANIRATAAGRLIFSTNASGDVVLVPLKNSQGVEKTVAVPAKLLDQARRDYKLFNGGGVSDAEALGLSAIQTIRTENLTQSQWVSGFCIETSRSHDDPQYFEDSRDDIETRSTGTTTSGVSMVRQVNPNSEEDVDTIFDSLLLPTKGGVEMQSMKSGISSASTRSKVVRIITAEQVDRILEIFPGVTDAVGNYAGQNPLFDPANNADETRSVGTMFSTASGASNDSLVIRIKSAEDVEMILEITPSALERIITSHLGNNPFFHPKPTVLTL